jgi:hypothetical protein
MILASRLSSSTAVLALLASFLFHTNHNRLPGQDEPLMNKRFLDYARCSSCCHIGLMCRSFGDARIAQNSDFFVDGQTGLSACWHIVAPTLKMR